MLTIKTIKNRQDKLIIQARDLQDHMEDVYWSRSDHWQDSDQGHDYMEKIELLDDAINTMEMALEELDKALDI